MIEITTDMMQSESINELASAMVGFQYSLMGAKKDSANPYFKSKYADLQSCQDAIREPLFANGLAITQTTRVTENGIPVLVTTLMHSSGQWIKGELPLSASKQNDPQAQGSAITYARRYALCAITGLYQTDDDAEAAQGRGQTQQASTRQQASPKQSNGSNSTTGSAPTATGKTATTTNNATAAANAGAQDGKPAPKPAATTSGTSNVSKTETASAAPAAASKEQTAAASAEPITAEDMQALLKAGTDNGWSQQQIAKFVCYAFGVTASTLKEKLTKKQCAVTIKLLSRPENAANKVVVSADGSPISDKLVWPRPEQQ